MYITLHVGNYLAFGENEPFFPGEKKIFTEEVDFFRNYLTLDHGSVGIAEPKARQSLVLRLKLICHHIW